MPIYGSVERLNAMHSLFTTQGNKRLDAGEVDALAAFAKGLPASSEKKVHGRLAEIYQDSKFSSGQKGRMLGLLKSQGFTTQELEPGKLSKEAQLDQLRERSDDAKTIKLSSVDMVTRGKLKAELAKIEKSIMKDKGADTIIGDLELKSVRGPKKELLGYIVEIPIYADEHDVDEAHYFNTKAQHLGSDYIGE